MGVDDVKVGEDVRNQGLIRFRPESRRRARLLSFCGYAPDRDEMWREELVTFGDAKVVSRARLWRP
jgi:hypothetical protein